MSSNCNIRCYFLETCFPSEILKYNTNPPPSCFIVRSTLMTSLVGNDNDNEITFIFRQYVCF